MKYTKNNIVYDEYRGIPNEDGKLVLGMTRAEILSLGYTPFLGNDLTDDGRTSKYQLEPYYIDFYSLYGETEALTQEVVLDTDLDDAIKAYEDGRELIIRYWGELPEGSTDLRSIQESGEARINAVYHFSNIETGNLVFRSSFPVNIIDSTRYTKSNYNCVTISTGTNPKVLSFYPASDTFVSVSQVAELVEEEYVDLTKNAQGNIIVNSGSSSVDVADYVRYVESSSPNITRIFRRVSSKSESGGPMSISGNTASYVFSEINGTSNSTNILVCTLGQGSVAGGEWELRENISALTFDTTPTANSTNPVTSGGIYTALSDKQETLVSGSNIKTVNGTSLLGSGDLAVVSVDAGDINVMQSTGDSQVNVMSQKAVTDELLLDYSTNFRSLVWEGGLISSNNGANGTNGNYYRTRDYIEISNTTTGVVLNIDGTFDIMFYNSSGGYLGYRTITNNSVEITRATYPTLGRIRACCYKTYYTIKNLANTTVKASNYELLKSAIKQTTGQSEGSLMSQKAITDSIYRNIKVQNCSCGYLKPNTNHVINLTDAQYSRLNATDVASFRFILTEPENYASVSMTLRYVGINGNNTNSSADNAFEFEWDYSKRMFARGKNYNTATCINKTSSGTIINPLVFTLVWDRTNGIIKYYERNTLISTQTYDEYKLDYFIAPSKSICFHGGDTGFYLYDVQIFDYDISKLFFATYENTLYGASMVFTKYTNNFRNSTDNWVERNGNYSTYGGSFNGTIESTFPGDGTRVLTSTSNCTTSTYHTCGYYVGNSVQLQRWECDIEVVSGECAIRVGNASSSVITSIVDSNNNVYSGGDTLGVGNYTVKGVSGGTGVWYLYYRSGSMQVIYKKQKYKLISCVVHLKCDTFYDGFLYDDQAKHFYDQSNGLVPDNTPFTLPRTTTSNPPNYAGQMAVPSNGNIYIGTKNYTWKQINNS